SHVSPGVLNYLSLTLERFGSIPICRVRIYRRSRPPPDAIDAGLYLAGIDTKQSSLLDAVSSAGDRTRGFVLAECQSLEAKRWRQGNVNSGFDFHLVQIWKRRD